MKKHSIYAPGYTCPVCKVIEARIEQRILDGSPFSATVGETVEDDLGEY